MSDIFEQIKLPSGITEDKIQFLRDAVAGATDLPNNQVIPYFTKLVRTATEKNINFTEEEIKFLIIAIKNNSSEEDKMRIDKLLQMKTSI